MNEKFSKLGLAQAYLQMEMEEGLRVFLTINLEKDLFQYIWLVFGVASTPVAWQRAMDKILQGIPSCRFYLDDITRER
uniref:Uncharacterized protein n=1 Tax=Chelonoidis abingdonii TaxID=106734 RepID=A0A8C0IL22_CHEAB